MSEDGRYIGACSCREWVLSVHGRGHCGLCGEWPYYLRPYDPEVD